MTSASHRHLGSGGEPFPAGPHDLLVSVAPAGRVEVATATTRARVAQREWWAAGAGTRANALKGVSDALSARAAEAVDLMVREVGKPVVEARGEVARARSILDFYAQHCLGPTSTWRLSCSTAMPA